MNEEEFHKTIKKLRKVYEPLNTVVTNNLLAAIASELYQIKVLLRRDKNGKV